MHAKLFVLNKLSSVLVCLATVSMTIGEEVKTPTIIAHRGASSAAPENTGAAIREATRVGSKVVEFDVRVTTDGKLLLFHDGDLKRFFSSSKTFESLTEKEAVTLDVGSWFQGGKFPDERPISLEAAIKLCHEGGAVPLIERKSGDAKAYADVIREMGVTDTVIVQAFDWKFLTALKKEMPEVALGALGSKELDSERWGRLQKLKPDWIGWSHKDFALSDLEKVHEMGAKVALWTANDMKEVARFLEAGIDGIITDEPEKALKLLPAQ